MFLLCFVFVAPDPNGDDVVDDDGGDDDDGDDEEDISLLKLNKGLIESIDKFDVDNRKDDETKLLTNWKYEKSNNDWPFLCLKILLLFIKINLFLRMVVAVLLAV